MTLLPRFTYHPDAVATGSIAWSSATCRCCDQARGYIYVGPVFAQDELHDALCPWCIADGSAAAKFDATFVDDIELTNRGLTPDLAERIVRTTPSYGGRQQEQWLVHCGDACSFHGEATLSDIRTMPDSVKERMAETDTNQVDWDLAAQRYKPGGRLGIYKFCCLHCGEQLLASDCD